MPMLGRVLGKKSHSNSTSHHNGSSAYDREPAGGLDTGIASTGRLNRYSDRSKALTHTVDPTTGRIRYPDYPSPPSTPGVEERASNNSFGSYGLIPASTSNTSGAQYSAGAGIARTVSQTSAQRYKNSILSREQQQQQQQDRAPQLPPLSTPSPLAEDSERDVFADAVAQHQTARASGRSSNVKSLSSGLRQSHIHDVEEGNEDEDEEEEEPTSAGGAVGIVGSSLATAAAGGAAVGSAVLGKLFGGSTVRDAQAESNGYAASSPRGGQDGSLNRIQKPLLREDQANGARSPANSSSNNSASGLPISRKPVPKAEDLEHEDYNDRTQYPPGNHRMAATQAGRDRPGNGPNGTTPGRSISGETQSTRGGPEPVVRGATAAQTGRARQLRLTAQQRHYLIKALTLLQMASEARELEKLGELTLYGHPFSAERPRLKRIKKDLVNEYTSGGDFEAEADDPYAEADDDVVRRAEGLQEPVILRHMFHAHLHPFPGLDKAPLKYWQQRIQVFFDEMAARNFSTSMERGEITKRRFFALAGIRYLGVFFARGIGVRGEGELPGPGPGEPGTDKWGRSKQWGKGTVKRGLDKPIRINQDVMRQIDDLFPSGLEGQQWQQAGKESQRVRRDWQAFKEHVIEHEDGIEDVHRQMDINNLKNLPPHYRNAEEWARNHAAYILHTLFVASPDADSTFKVLKGIHTLFPYWGAKQLLKYANAQLMIQGILSLLLARPAGAKSLVQRIFAFVIGKEASSIEKELIVPIKKAIQETELAQLVEGYVKRGSRPERRNIKKKTLQTGNDVLTTILIEGNHNKPSKAMQDRIFEMQHCFGLSNFRSDLNAAYPDGTPIAAAREQRVSSGLSGEQARMATQFALLKLLLRECLKKRDREQASAVASGSLIPTIIKDSLENVFYAVIGQIAKTADLSGRLGDLQAFLDDMIEVKKRRDDSLQAWIALAARHENSLYYIFHECAPIMQPFLEWLQLGSDYMAMSTSDPSNPANRKAKNIEVNVEAMLSDPRLTDDDVRGILREVDSLTQWTLWQKVYYELELRKNFLLARPDAAPFDLGEENIASPGFKRALEDLDGLFMKVLDRNGIKANDGVCRSEARGTEASDFPWIFFDDVDPCGQHLMAEDDVAELRYTPKQVAYPPPTLLHVRKLLPVFCDTLLSEMPDYRGRKTAPGADARRGSAVSTSASASNANSDARSTKSKKSGFKIPFL